MKFTDNKGGMLLFTVVATLVMSFTCATLATLMLNERLLIDQEIKRKEAMNIARAGMEYAYDLMNEELTVPSSMEITSAAGTVYTVNLAVVAPSLGDDDYGVSDYRIDATVEYDV